MPAAGFAQLQHAAGGGVERGEDRRRAMPLVVMGHGAGPARLQRQARLGPVQRLGLRLLVDAQHHRPLRRVEVQPDHVDELGLEAGIGRQLERVDPPRPQLAGLPHPGHGVLAHPVPLTQRAGRPLGRTVVGHRVQRVVHDGLDRGLGDLRLASPARGDHSHPGHTRAQVAVPPSGHRVRIRPHCRRRRPHRRPIGQGQQRPGLHHLAMRRHRRTGQPLQLDPISLGHLHNLNHARSYATPLFQRRTTRPCRSRRRDRPAG